MPFHDRQAHLSSSQAAHARSYDLVVAGSTWNAETLRNHGVSNVAVVLETKTPQNRTVTSYDATTRTLTLAEQEAAPDVGPGTSLRLIGHKLQAGRRLYMQHCMHCHGVGGRTPMHLHRPDEIGFLTMSSLLFNYRTLQERMDFNNIEKSKLLRKPLNVQTGEEDGHQGGRRYQPMDPGYQILRRWVLSQARLESARKSKAAF